MSPSRPDAGDGVGLQAVGHVGVHHDLVDVDHRAHRVEVHGGALLRDRYGQHGVGQVGGEHLAREPLGTRGRGALADADGDDAGREQQYVAALDVLALPAVQLRRTGEPGVLGVDQVGQLGLALARRHRQRGDRDPVADPDAGVAGEQQVGERVDEEVVAGEQAGDQAVAAAHLVVADAGGEERRQLVGRLVVERLVEVTAQRVAEVQARHRTGDRAVAGVGALQGLGEQVHEVEHLDVAGAQRLGERVVLVLRAADPGDAVEEELVVVARGEPLQLRPGPVQHDRAQPADLAVRSLEAVLCSGVRAHARSVSAGRGHPGRPVAGLRRSRARTT